MEKFNLKVGDKVVVKKNLKIGKVYGENELKFDAEMAIFKGKAISIDSINRLDSRGYKYSIEEEFHYLWNWNQAMFTVASMRKACKGR